MFRAHFELLSNPDSQRKCYTVSHVYYTQGKQMSLWLPWSEDLSGEQQINVPVGLQFAH